MYGYPMQHVLGAAAAAAVYATGVAAAANLFVSQLAYKVQIGPRDELRQRLVQVQH